MVDIANFCVPFSQSQHDSLGIRMQFSGTTKLLRNWGGGGGLKTVFLSDFIIFKNSGGGEG